MISSAATIRELPGGQRLRIGACVGYLVALTALFMQPLVRLVVHAVQDDLHSHIPLIPVIVAYLLYAGPKRHVTRYGCSIPGALILGAVAFVALGVRIGLRESLSANDQLAVMALAYLGFIAAGGFVFLGARWMAAAAFPVSFLLFMIPLPDAAADVLERASAVASADIAAGLFRLTGTPLLREGTALALPGIVLDVARQCSGIRSSWVLFITSVLGSYLFLQSPWRRIVLVAFVIPLGIVRNAFRILVIGLLCVHVGPHMIDSAIHQRGGPVFFLLSLVPVLLLVSWLRGREHRQHLQGVPQ